MAFCPNHARRPGVFARLGNRRMTFRSRLIDFQNQGREWVRLPFAAAWEKLDDDQYFETCSGPFPEGLDLGIAAVTFAVAVDPSSFAVDPSSFDLGIAAVAFAVSVDPSSFALGSLAAEEPFLRQMTRTILWPHQIDRLNNQQLIWHYLEIPRLPASVVAAGIVVAGLSDSNRSYLRFRTCRPS